jgi:hypothetical protein
VRGHFLPPIAALVFAGVLSACAPEAIEGSALPHAYLEQAKQAAEKRDAPRTLAALDRAEQAWEGANTPYGNPEIDADPEALRAIARARQSVEMHRWDDALYYIDAALTHPSTLLPGQP